MDVSDIEDRLMRGMPAMERYQLFRKRHAVRLAKRDLSRFPLAKERLAQVIAEPGRWFTEESIRDSLMACRAREIVVSTEGNNISIKWRTSRITLTDGTHTIPLGAFDVAIYYRSADSTVSGTAFALDPNPHKIKGYSHPHVHTSGSMCLGMAGGIMANMFRSGHFDAVVDVCDEMLHTFNAESPYCHLTDWNGYQCSACGVGSSSDRKCAECRGYVCNDCLVAEDGCFWCPGCCEECDQCGGFSRRPAVTPCCGKKYCRSCLNVQ